MRTTDVRFIYYMIIYNSIRNSMRRITQLPSKSHNFCRPRGSIVLIKTTAIHIFIKPLSTVVINIRALYIVWVWVCVSVFYAFSNIRVSCNRCLFTTTIHARYGNEYEKNNNYDLLVGAWARHVRFAQTEIASDPKTNPFNLSINYNNTITGDKIKNISKIITQLVDKCFIWYIITLVMQLGLPTCEVPANTCPNHLRSFITMSYIF